MTPAAIHYPIARIVEGPRFRQHVGDLTALAASMAALGLLHPIVITPDSHLIAGARRLAAAKQLGWTAIAVRVVDTADLLRCEHDENELRKDFTVPERVKIGMALEKEIAERNAQKQREAGKEGGRGHRKETSGEILPEGFDDHPTRPHSETHRRADSPALGVASRPRPARRTDGRPPRTGVGQG